MMKFFGREGKVTINGKTYIGNNIVISDGQVIVDGQVQDGLDNNKIEVSVLCNVDKIVSDESIYVKGNINGNIEAHHNVNCNSVSGDVKAGMNVNCDDIGGNVTAGMNVNCDRIDGSVQAKIVNRS